jgi:hypothetical protein
MGFLIGHAFQKVLESLFAIDFRRMRRLEVFAMQSNSQWRRPMDLPYPMISIANPP